LFVLATCSVYALANVVLVTAQWDFNDIHAYLGAAQRLLAHEPLYVVTPDPSAIYRYAPWFGFLRIPLASLPQIAVEVAWAAVLVGATVACLLPLVRSWTGVALALLLGGLLYRTAGWGNVQPLVTAALVYGLPTRAGPWLVGLAASLKPWPILAVVVYAWRRQWSAAAISLRVAVALWPRSCSSTGPKI
jgi:glycosyl transferase family 87